MEPLHAAAAETTRDMPPQSLRAVVRPGSVNPEKRTVDVIWTTGAKVLRGTFDRYYEELSLDPAHVRMARLNNGAPLLNMHNLYDSRSVLGVVESARLERNKGTATVRFAKAEDDPEADKVFRKVQDGIVQNVSVGYRTYKLEKVAGGDTEIPTYRAVDWEPIEISVVPAGEDDGAGFRSEKQVPNPCVFSTQQQERTMPEPTIPAITTAQPAAVPAAAPAPVSAEARAAELHAAEERAVGVERERVTAIRSLVTQHKLPEEFATRLLGDAQNPGRSLVEARSLILDELARRSAEQPPSENGQHLSVTAGEDQHDKFGRGCSAWLFERAGLSDVIRRAAKIDPARFGDVALDPGEYRGMSLYDVVRECAERSGIRSRGLGRMELVGEVFKRAAYQTASDFPVLFENVMRKSLQADYLLAPDTWSRFCKAELVPDFRDSSRYRAGSIGNLDVVNEGGEITRATMPDGSKLSIGVQTYAKIIGLSRKAIINDDMGALTDVATKLGRGAKRTIEAAVYALLNANSGLGPTQSDSSPFFDATARGNVNGTGSALSCAGIDADRVVMGKQKDPSGNDYLDLRPAVLLVPDGLEATAKSVNNDAYDHDAAKLQKKNPVGGLFRDIVATPRLTDTTRRYLFADPSYVPAFVVAFLEGDGQAPVLEVQRGWDIDGVEWKIRLDFKAQCFDPKGALTNAGK